MSTGKINLYLRIAREENLAFLIYSSNLLRQAL